MGLAEWLRTFRVMHEKARQGTLSDEDTCAYQADRDELARAFIAAQRLTVNPAENRRQALRVARALQVDLETRVTHVRAMTQTLSIGGFSALLAKAPSPTEEITCSIRMPGADPLVATVVPASVTPQPGSVRVSFVFKKLPDPDRERLEFLIFDTVLAQLVK